MTDYYILRLGDSNEYSILRSFKNNELVVEAANVGSYNNAQLLIEALIGAYEKKQAADKEAEEAFYKRLEETHVFIEDYGSDSSLCFCEKPLKDRIHYAGPDKKHPYLTGQDGLCICERTEFHPIHITP